MDTTYAEADRDEGRAPRYLSVGVGACLKKWGDPIYRTVLQQMTG